MSIKMSMSKNQARPERCYCRIQDDGDINDIAKIITVLNYKLAQLRNEVTALKNGNPAKEKLVEDSGDGRKYLCSRCYEKKCGNSQTCLNFNKSVIPEESKHLTQAFENELKKAEKDIPKDVSDVINLSLNEKEETSSKPISKKIIKRKKFSRGVQCSSEMERKRKYFLNCLKKESNVKEEYYWKPSKKPRLSSMCDFYQDFGYEANDYNYINTERPRAEQLCRLCKTYAHNRKLQEMQISENELAAYKMDKQKDERESFESSINRMVGGAECRGNRLISDFGDKLLKINLYKNIKFNIKNVKNRLDACIIELNEIIEDVSYLLPKPDT